VFAFQLAYAIGFLFAGRVMDLLGIKRGFALALTIWSLAAMAAAEVERFGPAAAGPPRHRRPHLLGVGRRLHSRAFRPGTRRIGQLPAAIKTVAEWFPQRERAFATGLFNAGTNIGAVITPMTVPFITARFGWYWAFVLTGVLGFGWLIAWLMLYEKPDRHPRLSARSALSSPATRPCRRRTCRGRVSSAIARPGRSPRRSF
jgi:ACS family hexuronate transporter-like MFS transporter